MDGPQLPGAAVDREERIVCHVDMDCFYASCERLREPELAGEPVVVGMGYEPGERHGAVATASYEAREYGVESAQPIRQALDALPRAADVDADSTAEDAVGHYRPVDLDFYQSIADDIRAILRECADTVREVSIDEAYLDVTDRTSWETVDDTGERGGADTAEATGDSDDAISIADSDATDRGRTLAEGYARHVKQRIDREVGVPASVGVAPNMSTAKVASDHDKPDGLTVVGPGEVRSFLAPLSVEAIHGVGPVTAGELREMGVETASDLAAADPAVLADRFGQRGRDLHARARGDDDRAVRPTGRPKSLSRESAFTEATAEETAKRETVSALAADVAARARNRGAMYRTIGIKVVRPPFESNTRVSSLSGPVDDPALVERVALDLLAEFADDPVRKLGVRVSNLTFAAHNQARLDGFEAAGGDGETADDSTVDTDADTAGDLTSGTNADTGGRAAAAGGRLTDWTEIEAEEIDAATRSEESTPSDGQSSLGEFDSA